MIRWFISLMLIIFVLLWFNSFVEAQQLNADSLFMAISFQEDYAVEQFRYWILDSLEKRMNLTANEKSQIQGRGRTFRANWFDNWRITRGLSSKLSNISSDTSFNVITHEVFHSANLLAAVVLERNFQKISEDGRRINAVESVTKTSVPFKDLNEYNSFLNSFNNKYFKWEKKGNTVYYASSLSGDDSDNGTTWALAEATLGAVQGDASDGDTLACNGSFGELLAISLSGSSGSSKVTWMDSLSFTLGVNSTNPDTSKIWSATIEGGDTRANCVSFDGDSYVDMVGFYFKNSTSIARNQGGTSGGNMLWQCKFDSISGSGNEAQYISHTSSSVQDSVISCLFIGNGGNDAFLISNVTGSLFWVNNTMTGTAQWRAFSYGSDQGVKWEVKNNIFSHNTDIWGMVTDQSDMVEDGSDWDNNMYYFNSRTETQRYWFITSLATWAVWQDSLQIYDGDAETNGSEANPGLNSITTTAFITTGSGAYDTAENNAWNDASNPSAGYFQPTAAPTGVGQVIFIRR